MSCRSVKDVLRQWGYSKDGKAGMQKDELASLFRTLMRGKFSDEQLEAVVCEISNGENPIPIENIIRWIDRGMLLSPKNAKSEKSGGGGSSSRFGNMEEQPPASLPGQVEEPSSPSSPKMDELANQVQGLARQFLTLSVELELQKKQVTSLSDQLKRQYPQFTMGQYNILAGYLGNNMEPWFLYGVDMPPERRKRVNAKHGEKGPNGNYLNEGWPNYVQGILSEEEQRQVEKVHEECFAWEPRKFRLLDHIRQLDADTLSLVECDYYEEFFKPELNKLGYESVWVKRPRPSSHDGCCIAWRRGVFELVAHGHVEYVDRYCPKQQRSYKDRVALMALLRFKLNGEKVCLISTHLARNPEQPEIDLLRARQIGQVVRALADFAVEHDCMDAPVVLTGDLNATSFSKLRGMACALALLREDTYVHPFTFDCKDVPTGVTSVTCARNVRIDALMYQSQRLELIDLNKVPKLSEAIPNRYHPSDHVPIRATFRLKTRWQMTQHYALEWYLGIAGRQATLVLSHDQLAEAFELYDKDCNGIMDIHELKRAIPEVISGHSASGLGSDVGRPDEVPQRLEVTRPEI
eukprot:TRINITY_DN14552_c0_g2_i2.p1 TRINITY_DN14552_c0_g2~~TRINITY_DN14552_c0_g2_i2.p1  ORF type:complete len:578 (+),score=119.31 TRINITY_DN14552_c0_g2_i2:89-1822(+)